VGAAGRNCEIDTENGGGSSDFSVRSARQKWFYICYWQKGKRLLKHTPWTHTQHPHTRSPLAHSQQLTSSSPTSSGCKAAFLALWASAPWFATYRSILKTGSSAHIHTPRREARANPHPYSFKLVFFLLRMTSDQVVLQGFSLPCTKDLRWSFFP